MFIAWTLLLRFKNLYARPYYIYIDNKYRKKMSASIKHLRILNQRLPNIVDQENLYVGFFFLFFFLNKLTD